MGLTPALIYLDSCIIIYLVEQHPVFAPLIEARLARQPDALLAFSSLSELECLVLPLRLNNLPLVEKFRNWFEMAAIYLPAERAIAGQAAQLRAIYAGLKTPDALHLATALHHRCTEFWTNDERLQKVAPHLTRNVCQS